MRFPQTGHCGAAAPGIAQIDNGPQEANSWPVSLNYWLANAEETLTAAARQVGDAGQREQLPGRQHRGALAQRPVTGQRALRDMGS